MRRVVCATAAASFERRASIGAARPPRTSLKLSPATRRIAFSHTVRIRPFSTNPHQSSGLMTWEAAASIGFSVCLLFLSGYMFLQVVPVRMYCWGFDGVVLPVVHVLGGPENAHRFVRRALAKGWLPKLWSSLRSLDDCRSQAEGVHVMEKSWEIPVGVTAAMDPEGKALEGMSRLGLSFVEIGPITLKPQEGDMIAHRKALAVGDRAPVNRYVIPSQGGPKTYCQLKKWRKDNSYEKLFVHLAPNDDSDDPADDIRRGMDWLADLGDYFVVSFPSSILHLPRNKRVEAMKRFCTDIGKTTKGGTEVNANRRRWYETDSNTILRPLLLKLSPDLSSEQLHDIASVALSHDITGLVICGNVRAETVPSTGDETDAAAAEDLVGLKEMSTRMVREMYALTEGKLPIIASGGVATAEDAYEKIRAGASLVQVGQALLVDHGLGSVYKLREGLVDLAHADFYKKLRHAIGADHKERKAKEIRQA